jgi:hypothetical protein
LPVCFLGHIIVIIPTKKADLCRPALRFIID